MAHPDRARYTFKLLYDESVHMWFALLNENWHGRTARTWTAWYTLPLDAALAAHETKRAWAAERRTYGDELPPISGGPGPDGELPF